MQRLIGILAGILIWAQAGAQEAVFRASADEYRAAIEAVQIQKNDKGLIPIRELTGRRFIFHEFNPAPGLGESLRKYVDLSESDGADMQDKDVLILSLSSRQDLMSIAKSLPAHKGRHILIFTGDLPEIELPFDAVLTLTKNDSLQNSIAAQIVFGGITKNKTPAPFRLGYAPPEAVGMNRQILEDSLRSILQFGIDQGAFPGAQVLIAKNGKIIYHKAFGFHTYDKKQPVSTDDIYDMASLTKVSAATLALMKLNSEGLFDLDAPMKKYWPAFKHTQKANLTWRNVLAHNARLKPWIPYWKNTLRKHPKRNGWRYKCFTFKDHPTRKYSVKITDNLWLNKRYRRKIFKAIKKSPLNPKPGYKYSGLSFYLIPTIVEKLSGTDFESYLKSNFYKPLGANTLTFNPLRFFDKSRIIPTERDTFFRMEQIHGTVHDEGAIMMGGVNGNAGLFGTANDMAKLWQMFLNKGTYGGKEYLPAGVVDEFTRCQFCDQGNHRGLGFDKPLISYDPQKANYSPKMSKDAFGHAGYTGTLIWADPKEDLLFIFLSNRVYPTRLNRKLYTLNIRPRLHSAVYQSLMK